MSKARATVLLLLSLLVLGAGVAIVVVLVKGDSSPTTSAPAAGAGSKDAAAGSGYLKAGNVELRYADGTFRRALLGLAEKTAGPPSDALAQAGQEIRVVRDASVRGVVAKAWRHSITVPTPQDPALQEFVDAWLGRGAAG